MTLPATVARCPGYSSRVEAWPFPRAGQTNDCDNCARRSQGIADYMAGAVVRWMTPPKETPCPEQLRPKR